MLRLRLKVTTIILVIAMLVLAACASAPRSLLRPNGVAIAPNGGMYIMDRGHNRVVYLSAEGKWLGAFGRLGRNPEDIYAGWDMAIDSTGRIYLCNQIHNENDELSHDGVKIFSPEGRFVGEIGGQDYNPSRDDDAIMHATYGLDVDAKDRVYITGYKSNILRVFDQQGKQIAQFFGVSGSQPGQFIGIQDVAVDDQRNLLYLSDNINSRVQQFSMTWGITGQLSLTHRLSFGTYGQAAGQFAYPQNLAVDDNNGRLYVGDMANHRIQVFDPQGQYLAEFSPPGVQVWQVMGLNVGRDGALYAADARNNTVWVFEPDGQVRSKIEVTP